jgi:nitroreductase
LKDATNARWADTDCAQAVCNMADAAWAMGLGTCWVGNFDAAAIAQRLGVPQNWSIFTVLPFGYPNPANPLQPKKLKPMRETVHFERFGNAQP